jgi:hypothetical protein
MADEPAERVLRWHHVLYAVLLLAAGYTAREGAGILMALIVLSFWGTMLWWQSLTVAEGLLIAGIVLVLLALLLPAVQVAREFNRRVACRNNLRNIGLALHNYHDDYGSFPPAVVYADDGTPMHSWRVLLLPYIDQASLYSRYRLDEPWDGPNNRQLLQTRPILYSCWSHEPEDTELARQQTSYAAIIGDDAAWPHDGSRTLDDLAGNADGTLLVCEWSGEPILWSEPRDLSQDQALAMFAGQQLPEQWPGHWSQDYFYDYEGSWNILLADGSVRAVGAAIEPHVWQALLDRHKSLSDVKADRFTSAPLVRRHPRWRHWIGLISFVVLSLLPLPWFWRRLVHPL